MSDRTVFTVVQGERHKVLLYSPLSSSYTATCVADLRKLPAGRTSYNPADTVADSYTVTTFAGDATYGPGFYFTLTGAETELLDPGVYVAEPLITYTAPSTWEDKPLSWLVEIQESITDTP